MAGRCAATRHQALCFASEQNRLGTIALEFIKVINFVMCFLM